MSRQGTSADFDNPNKYVFYRYEPSTPAAIVFIVLFFITTILHCIQASRRRTWFMIPFIIGGWFEVIGYIGRTLSTMDQWSLKYFIIQSLMLLVAPALFAASIYMTLGRIIRLVDGEKHSLIRAKWLTKIFVLGDIISFCTQGAGAGIMSGGDAEKFKTGEHIVVGGLCLQILCFGLFVVTAGVFHRRIARNPTHVTMRQKPTDQRKLTWKEKLLGSTKRSQSSSPINGTSYEHVGGASAGEHVDWEKHLYALYVASMLILVRSIFRVIEYVQGNNGYLLKNEVFLYIFDAVLMFLCMVWLNIVHPGEIHFGRSKDVRNGLDAEGFEMGHQMGHQRDESSPKGTTANVELVGSHGSGNRY